ncbi:MAG: superoxide dismutase [Deltaproteobacteria bacterium]|nr:superoxide dismutase [Deltaproteobacteria bacterium]
MTFKLPELPYALDALAPVMSRETLEFHYGKHHQRYVDNLNKLVAGSDLEKKSLEEIVKTSKPGGIFNNAAQIWNHTFFFLSLAPHGVKVSGKVKDAIDKQWGSFDKFKAEFSDAAVGLFGSGWVWLTQLPNGTLAIEKTKDAETPLTSGHKPLLTLDVWEHAYYIDYRNDRARFINGWWDIVNWDFVNKQFQASV